MSREVCGICWCPYDEETGECACAPQGPTPPPEAQTEAEKVAYCAGWWAALEQNRKHNKDPLLQQALEALKMMRDRYGEYACPACDHADAAIFALWKDLK